MGSAHLKTSPIKVWIGNLFLLPHEVWLFYDVRWKLRCRCRSFHFQASISNSTMVISDLPLAFAVLLLLVTAVVVEASDNNRVFSPCTDTTVEKSDGFTLGFAFATEQKFLFNKTLQLSPCDSRLGLTNGNSLISVFRPKVDEISLLTVNTTSSVSSFNPVSSSNFVFFVDVKVMDFLFALRLKLR